MLPLIIRKKEGGGDIENPIMQTGIQNIGLENINPHYLEFGQM